MGTVSSDLSTVLSAGLSTDLSSALKEFADNLAPSQSLVTEAGRIIDRLTRYLHSSQFKWSHYIDRIVPLGSYAKKSSLRIMMDLDVVVYLNDCHYPFEDFLSDLKDHIELSDSYTNCKLTGICLNFVAEGTLDVDLLPATNRVPRSEISRGRSAQEVQYEHTMSYIRNSSNPFSEGWKQSTALSETAVEFVKRRNERFHCSTMSRLAKFWSKTICIEGFYSGRSSIMEYIAIRSSEVEQSTGREKTLNAFRRFLTEMSNPEDMAIFWTDNYEETEIPHSIQNSRPLLLDPINPYNNMLRKQNAEFMLEMANFAKSTLIALNVAELTQLVRQPPDLAALLSPQPPWALLPFNWKREMQPIHFSVNLRDGDGLMMPKTIINWRMDQADRKIIEQFLFSFTEVTVAGYKKKGVENVAEKVLTDVQNVVAPGPLRGGGSNTDGRLEIPFTDERGMSKVLIVTFGLLSEPDSCRVS